MKKLSGSSGRSLLLLITNIALMFFGAITVASGSILIGIFLLHLFTFTSQLFLVVPVVLITSGTLTIIVAIFGLSLFKRKNEKSGVFLAYASIILVALLISLTASVTSFVLRESIAHRFSKTDVADQLQGYATDPFIRSRWDSIQREFRCCGGYNVGTGYADWEGVTVEPLPIGASPAALITGNDRSFVPTLSRVPDSCCIRERPGCGKTAFENDNNPSASISEKIHVNGCMTEARQTLFKHVMPLLLICALVSLVVGLIELLLLLCAVCFADHIKRLSSLDGSSSIGRSSSLSQEKQGIIQDTGEAYLSHEEKQLEYGLDNANPGYYNGEELIGNEDDSVSWYDSSTTDTRIRHQLPLLDGSPSLRKNRFFPFQGSQPSLNNGYELQNNQDPEAGPDSLQGNKNGAEEPIKSQESFEKSAPPPPADGLFGIFSIFSRLFDRKKSGVGHRQKHLNLREDALDREATLMNVLKSVTTNKSEQDLMEASKETKSGFNFFGMRSKSKENVLESATDGGAEGGKKDETEVKKLPTLDDKTIDKNKKFAPMENLTDAGKPKRGGLARLKRIRDEMFGKKHQTLKEEDVKEPTEIEDKPDSDEKKDGAENEDKKEGDLNFDEQKKKDDEDNGSTESSTETSSSSSESSDKSEVEQKVESRKSSKNEGQAESGSSKVERKPSNRSVHYEEDIKPQFKSGTPVRGSTFQRSISNENPPMTEEALRSISPTQQRVRVSGFGVTPQTNPRHTRTLSMTTSPKLNTIHEPVHHHPRVRTRSMHVTGTIPIDAVDDEIVQYGMARKSSRSPGPYNRSMSPQTSAYYLQQQQQNNNRLARMQSLARSEEHLNKAPVFVEYLRPVGILTASGSPPPGARPGSALGHSRDNSQEGHVTKIKIEDNADNDDEDRGREDSRTTRKKKDSSRSRDRSDSRKKSSKSRSGDKKKKKKSSKRRTSRSRSSSGRSDSSDSYSDSGSEDSSEDSESVSESDSDKKSRKKSRRSSRKDEKKSRKESKSKHRKKSKRHRSADSSPEKKHRKKSSGEKSAEKKKSKVVESSTSPTRESNSQRQPQHQAYDNHDYMNMTRNPYDNQGGFVVEAAPAPVQNHGYYSTATLPSSASLRKASAASGYQVVPIQGPPGVRAISEPRTAKKLVAATSTLDRYTLMAANAARSKSADRVPMKYRRVSLDPGSTGAYQLHQGYPGQQQSKVRSVSLATHEAGDIHVYNNAQMYRTTVEMEPHSGEMYAMQSGGRMPKTSRIRDDMILHQQHRRPTHISEARLMIQGDGGEQISLPHGMVHQY